jgi:hypothetical protein
MMTFDLLKHRFLPNRNDPRFDIINLSLGAAAGYEFPAIFLLVSFFRTVAVTLTYPTDVVRRLL